jgi:dihydropteroate synthase
MTFPAALHPRIPGLMIGVRTLVMGILNVTPDSFSGDGLAGGPEIAVRRAEALVAAGANILDLGGESTRPGHAEISADEELARVLPVLERLAGRLSAPISIDTRKSAVARAALEAGASVVNDVSGLTYSPDMARTAAEAGASLIVGHWRRRTAGDPPDTIAWLTTGLAESVKTATSQGMPRHQLIVDPGLGFAKSPPVSMEILRRLREVRAALGLPLLVGASRKGFIGAVLGRPVEERLAGSLATVSMAVAAGADAVRVHDVEQAAQVAQMSDAVVYGWHRHEADGVPRAWTPVYLALGTNLGERFAAISRALQLLDEHPDIRVLRRASLYETAPVGVTEQPAFLNTVVEALTTLTPRQTLDAVKAIERTLGRQTRARWGPREIDIDILLQGDVRLEEPGLTVPHARMWERLFVLAPLAELRSDLTGPDGRAIGAYVTVLRREQDGRSLGW